MRLLLSAVLALACWAAERRDPAAVEEAEAEAAAAAAAAATCPKGTRVNPSLADGAPACLACPANTFSDTLGALHCQPCPPESTAPMISSSACSWPRFDGCSMRPERHYCHGTLTDAGTRRVKTASVAKCHTLCAESANCAYFTYFTANAPAALVGTCLLVPKHACGEDRVTPYEGVLTYACVDPVQTATHQIVENEGGMQAGKFPWLKKFEAKNIEECERACLAVDSCRFGTFVMENAPAGGDPQFGVAATVGECWLAAATHSNAAKCGVPCQGFKKVARGDTRHWDDRADGSCFEPAGTCCTDKSTCWDGHEIGRDTRFGEASYCAFNYDYSCRLKRPTCDCDPTKTSSTFTRCHRDPWSRHVVVTHLSPRFHARPWDAQTQHRCMVVKNTVSDNEECACCDCHALAMPAGWHDLGYGRHLVGKTTDHPATSVRACADLCADIVEGCKWGSYVPSRGVCLLSTEEPLKDHDGRYRLVRCPGDVAESDCHAFSMDGRGFAHGDLVSSASPERPLHMTSGATTASGAKAWWTAQYKNCVWDTTGAGRCVASHSGSGLQPAPVCCKSMTAFCLACQAGLSVEQYCKLNPTAGHGCDLKDGDVRAGGGVTPRVGVPFVPEVLFDGKWHPVCARGGWADNDNGGETVCRQLGLGGGNAKATGAKFAHKDAMPVGRCRAGEPLTKCTAGENAWGQLATHGCMAGYAAGVEVTCAAADAAAGHRRRLLDDALKLLGYPNALRAESSQRTQWHNAPTSPADPTRTRHVEDWEGFRYHHSLPGTYDGDESACQELVDALYPVRWEPSADGDPSKGKCAYGCHTIQDQQRCENTDDLFSVDGVSQCTAGSYFVPETRECRACASGTYTEQALHFLTECTQCPSVALQASVTSWATCQTAECTRQCRLSSP